MRRVYSQTVFLAILQSVPMSDAFVPHPQPRDMFILVENNKVMSSVFVGTHLSEQASKSSRIQSHISQWGLREFE
ncbi:hypothetical protein V8B97DRAFT_1157297 [Scleroderma yunnanense]